MSKKAVIVSGGHQYLVAEKDKLEVELVGDKKTLSFEPLLVVDGKDVKVGTPNLSGGKVEAKVVEANQKADKVTSIRYKAKKRVNKKRGHRQQLSVVEITKIS